jgi:long-subunit acyl-CoA synthetase (AMP-forming)
LWRTFLPCSFETCIPIRSAESTANPASNAEELVYHLGISGSTSIIAHSNVLPVAIEAAKMSGIPHDRLVILGGPERVTPNFSGYNVHSLIEHGLSQEANFVERRLGPGEARTKVALLLFSSGTTGKPKVVNP